MDKQLSIFDDDFLQFSDLLILKFSENGELLEICPHQKEFLGWSIKNHHEFMLEEHFLAINKLTLTDFKLILQKSSGQFAEYWWKNVGGKLPQKLQTFWRWYSNENEGEFLLAFIKIEETNSKPLDMYNKKFFFQALNIPGFLHNLNGPLGTIFGRIELLASKYPKIKDFDEIIRVSYHLRSILNSFSYKIKHEDYTKKVKMNLNQFLSKELSFLECDLFFKHKVKKVEEFSDKVPEFSAHYITISGIFSEGFHFFRKYVDETKYYQLLVKSFTKGDTIGFSLDFMGEFYVLGNGKEELPLSTEGNPDELLANPCDGLDTNFLSECMKVNGGKIKISGNTTRFYLKYEIPLPKQTPAIKQMSYY